MQREEHWAPLSVGGGSYLGVELSKGRTTSSGHWKRCGKGARFRRCFELSFRSKFLWYRWVELSNESFRIYDLKEI